NVNDGTFSLNKTQLAFRSTIVNIGDGIGAAGSAILTVQQEGNTPLFALSIQADGIFNSTPSGADAIAGLTMTGGTVVVGNQVNDYGDVTTLASSSTATISGSVPGLSIFDLGYTGTHTFTVAQGTTPT